MQRTKNKIQGIQNSSYKRIKKKANFQSSSIINNPDSATSFIVCLKAQTIESIIMENDFSCIPKKAIFFFFFFFFFFWS